MTSITARVNLLDLAASALASVVVAADQIAAFCRPELGHDAKNIRMKNDGSLLTDADIAAQSIIFQVVQSVSADVRLIGEESPEEMAEQEITGHEERSEAIYRLAQKEIRIRYDRLDEPMPLAHPNVAGIDAHQNSSMEMTSAPLTRIEECEVDASRVTVIIDPLDGTKAYARGDYEPVSILIAIILDGLPCFGVICKPFGYPGQTCILDTGCVAIYGGTLLGAVYTAGGAICNPRLSTPDSLPRAVISSSKSKGVVEQVISKLGDMGIIDPEPLMVSGAGEKSLRIIMRSENEGLWFFPKPGTSLWDVAASDALLRAMGGILTDKYGKDIDYNKPRSEAENVDGIVASYDKNIHEKCIQLYLEGNWDDP